MKVVVIDPQKNLNYVEVAYDLVRLDSADQMKEVAKHDVDILVLNDKISDISIIDGFTKDNVWKICIHEDFEQEYPVQKWKEFCFVEIIKSDFDFNKLRSLQDSTALINHKINFKDKFDFDSVINKKLQLTIDKVFKDDLDILGDSNMSDDNSGLKIKVPNDLNADASLNISLDLDNDSAVHETPQVSADDTGLDMGDLDASNLSLGADEAALGDIAAGAPQEREGDLDFSDTSLPAFSLHAKGEEIDNIVPESDLSAEADDLDASINDLDGIDNFEDLDLSSDELDNLDDLGDINDSDLSDDLSFSDDEGDDQLGEVTGKTQITTSEDLKEINSKVEKAAIEDDQVIENIAEQSPELAAISEKVEPIGTDTFKKSMNTLLGIKAPSFSTKVDETGEIDIATLLGKEEETEEVAEATKNLHQVSSPNIKEQVASENYASVNSRYSADDLLDIKITLSELKDDRKNLLDEITNLEHDKDKLLRDNLNLKADLDELKIELSIMKKRHVAELEDYKHQNSILLEKREVLEAKNKNYQREIERLGSKIRIDFSKIKQREKELEGQLELVSIDADSKVKSRDLKILELKRKIDALEFNMENISIKEKQSVQDKSVLEDKLNRVVGTLRNSLSLLEQDIDISEITKSFKNENDL